MRKVTLFFLFCLTLGLATSCNESDNDDFLHPIEPENLPMFQFDEQGIPYRWETPTLSEEMQQNLVKQVVGYGWKWMQTNEIQDDGHVNHEGYYENLYGPSPASYYIKSDKELVKYFWSDAIPAMAFLDHLYTMDMTKGILAAGNPSPSIYPWSVFIRIWGIWQLDGKWYMTTIEPLGIRGNGNGGYKTIWACSQYIRMSNDELKQMQKDYTFDYSRVN